MPVLPEVDARRGVLADGQQPGVAPQRVRAGFDVGAGDARQRLGIVADLQRAETLEARVLRTEWVGRAAVATDEAPEAGEGTVGRSRNQRSHRTRPFSSSSPCHVIHTGRSWHLRRRPRVDQTSSDTDLPVSLHRTRGCRGFSGPVPLPLLMSGAIRL